MCIFTQQVKLSSGQNKIESMIAVASNILASISSESMIRFWDFENNDTYNLSLQKYSEGPVSETVTAIAYNRNTGMYIQMHCCECWVYWVSVAELLAAGTSGGSVLLWKWNEGKMPAKEGDSNNMDLSASWEFIASTPVTPPAAHLTVSLASIYFSLVNLWILLQWNMEKNLLAVNSNKSVQILSEHAVSTSYNQKVRMLQHDNIV